MGGGGDGSGGRDCARDNSKPKRVLTVNDKIKNVQNSFRDDLIVLRSIWFGKVRTLGFGWRGQKKCWVMERG